MLARIGRAALDFLLPPHCLACDAEVQTQGGFCPACFRGITMITPPCCARCGVPFGHPGQAPGGVCPACAQAPPPWGRARAALAYDAQSRRVVLALKHADRTDLAAALAPWMRRAGRELLDDADLLVPVPLHRARLFARRYNQAALLARAVGRLAGLPVLPDALRRTRRTAPLADRSAEQRARELDGAIAVRRARAPRIAGRRVVLVDDVLTSGATGGACARALLAAGAARVDVLVAARVPDPRLR